MPQATLPSGKEHPRIQWIGGWGVLRVDVDVIAFGKRNISFPYGASNFDSSIFHPTA
jgi:hypothetical protein